LEQENSKLKRLLAEAGRSGTFYLAHTATMRKGDAGSGVMKIVAVRNS
jgi:hypothetical protein